jgi:TolA-binding protein
MNDNPTQRTAMTTFVARVAIVALFAAALAFAGTAQAQSTGSRSGSGGLLGDLFGGGHSPRGGETTGQLSDADLVVRIDRLENHIRQLTGAIEQLQFRNQQLEQAVRNMQEDRSTGQPMRPMQSPVAAPPAPLPQSDRRSDVFDPTLHPNAPGAPRSLGGGSLVIAGPEPAAQVNAPRVGIAGGREAGAPLDLSSVAQPLPPAHQTSLSGMTTDPAAGLPPPPPRNPSSTGALAAVQPPSQSPEDVYDLAYGYMLRKDYALAEAGFRNFLQK